MSGKLHHLWNIHYTPMCLSASSMTIKLPSPSKCSFINCYPHLTPYQGYGTLAYPYLSTMLTIESNVIMTIFWGSMGIKVIPSSGLYSLINFK